MNARAGITLIELLVYMVLSLIVLSVIAMVVNGVHHTGASASSSFVLGQDSAVGFEKLRQDFNDTSLQSIRVVAEPVAQSPSSWVSLAGARNLQHKLQVTPFGAPAWNQYICYRLLPDQDGDGITSLVRYQVPQKFPGADPKWAGGMPVPSAAPLPQTAQVETIFNQIVAPGFGFGESSPGVLASVADRSKIRGGFEVNFVRQGPDGQRSLSPLNPNQGSDRNTPGWSNQSTSMLEIRLTMAEKNSSTGKYSLISLPILLTPRH